MKEHVVGIKQIAVATGGDSGPDVLYALTANGAIYKKIILGDNKWELVSLEVK